MILELHLILKSDATLSRGDGVVGLVDEEIEHDTTTGLPFIRGRTLKGLLVEECSNILYALERSKSPLLGQLQEASKFLFGQPGSTLNDDAVMRVGPAMLPKELCNAVEVDVKSGRLTPTQALESLTSVRRQTAIDEKTGAPDEGSLRSIRVVLRQTSFIAQLNFDKDPDDNALALLAACALSFRRAGTSRNRGLGRLMARLHDPTKPPDQDDVTDEYFKRFKSIVS